ncbi:MAG TPA: hypothetical protein VNI01_08795 [Elusimicrobiota bacterium]|jgi:hypothetical protein|nr:hypothetical protein [Elusimicrobiota bacterium]
MITAVRCGAWALFAVLWAAFTRSDYRWNKIRNRSIAWGLLAGAAAYGAFAVGTWLGKGSYFFWDFYPAALAHVAVAWAVAVAFWALKIWPAGDAKLFAMLSVLFPIMDPLSPLLPARAVLVALMNIFIPAAVFIVLWAFHWLWKTRFVKRWEFARSLGLSRWLARQREGLGASPLGDAFAAASGRLRGKPGESAWLALEWAAFFVAAGLFLTALSTRYGARPWTGLALCAFSFFIWRGLSALLGARALSVALFAGAGVFWRLHPEFPWGAAARNAVHLMVFGTAVGAGVKAMVAWAKGGRGALWLLLSLPLLAGLAGPFVRVSFGQLLFGAFLGLGLAAVLIQIKEDPYDWRARDIQPYLVLAPSSVELLRGDERFFEEHFSTRYPDGLTPEQAKALKGWCARRSVERVAMQRTLSFAFWIFSGFFLTGVLRRDLLSFVVH